VSSQGIKVYPNKLKAIQVMLALKTGKKNLKGFLGHLNYIGWFIS